MKMINILKLDLLTVLIKAEYMLYDRILLDSILKIELNYSLMK